MNREIVLCVNSGSSSMKVALFEVEGNEERRLTDASVSLVSDTAACLKEVLAKMDRYPRPTMAGHRVVHGGPRHIKPARIDAAIVGDLRKLVPFAPLHMPSAIAGIEAVKGIPQVACFDTAFHATIPDFARRFAIPDRFEDVRRYGFHGLSYEYIVGTLPKIPSRVVIAHLGSGASLVAVKDGKSIDTTMGLTPTGGIPMSTRSGDLDPGVLLYLLREKKLDVKELADVIDKEAGLKALAGTSDMREILDRRRKGDARADLAFRVFTYAIRKAVGALAAALEGLDLLVFTGGIGEKSAEVRDEVVRGLGYLNAEVRVIETDEDRMVARHTYATLAR